MKPGNRSNPRRCIATGVSRPKSDLVRFAVSPEGMVVPDVLGRLPGRGMWVTATAGAVEKAMEKQLFARAAKRPVAIPRDLARNVENQLARRVIDFLLIARKSGTAVAGFTKVRGAMAAGRVRLLLQAGDGSPGQLRKISAQDCNISCFRCLSAKELGIAFARDYVIHAAVESCGAAARLREEACRLRGFRPNAAFAQREHGNFGNVAIQA